jgi:hypothetical protein
MNENEVRRGCSSNFRKDIQKVFLKKDYTKFGNYKRKKRI